jgi:hypothetical protein
LVFGVFAFFFAPLRETNSLYTGMIKSLEIIKWKHTNALPLSLSTETSQIGRDISLKTSVPEAQF